MDSQLKKINGQPIAPYDHFKVNDRENDLKLTVGEPDMYNPNGFANMLTILRNLGTRACIEKYLPDCSDNGRKWVFLENDGGILIYIYKFIFNMIRCNECSQLHYGRKSFDDHKCKGVINFNFDYEFDWIVPQSGLLHVEINAGKSFMSLCWDVFLKEVCKTLGFVSPNALAYAKKGSDHHKMWDILEICYIALSHEIITLFIKECKRLNVQPSIKYFWLWKSEIKNRNVLFLIEMTFTYLHAMMMLRKGSRCNNENLIYAAKNKLASLFFGRNHPNYHRLIVHEKRVEHNMPAELKAIKDASLVMSRTKSKGHYQSGDAMIEEINKEAKRDVVGIPSEKQWIQSFRNLNNINSLRKATYRDTGLKDPKESVSRAKVDIQDEVRKVRVMIRRMNYLTKPYEDCPHTDITKTIELSKNLINFSLIAKENIREYVPKILCDES